MIRSLTPSFSTAQQQGRRTIRPVSLWRLYGYGYGLCMNPLLIMHSSERRSLTRSCQSQLNCSHLPLLLLLLFTHAHCTAHLDVVCIGISCCIQRFSHSHSITLYIRPTARLPNIFIPIWHATAFKGRI